MLASIESGRPATQRLAVDDVPHAPEGAFGVDDVRQDEAELVAAEPRDGVAEAGLDLQATCELGQEVVTVLVAEGVVYLFESIEIDDGDRGRTRAAVRSECRHGAAVEQRPVRKVGERVVLGEEGVPRHLPAQAAAGGRRDDQEHQVEQCQADGEIPVEVVEVGGDVRVDRRVRQVDLEDADPLRGVPAWSGR